MVVQHLSSECLISVCVSDSNCVGGDEWPHQEWGCPCTPCTIERVLPCLEAYIWIKVFPEENAGKIMIVMQQLLLVPCIFRKDNMDFFFSLRVMM